MKIEYTSADLKKECSDVIGKFISGDKAGAEKVLKSITENIVSKKILKASKSTSII